MTRTEKTKLLSALLCVGSGFYILGIIATGTLLALEPPGWCWFLVGFAGTMLAFVVALLIAGVFAREK